ncbi:MAG: TIGR03663 family protein [Anaerolineales bacterium]|nr:TIGR03663 family protein [Anaerolineales bacterium]
MTLHAWLKSITWEKALFGLILILAIITRFNDLGSRVISHDESQHVHFSWLLYKGYGYTHTPITHGPLQFHLIALSYALFGASDATSRLPQAIASVVTVAFLWCYRRYLGRTGTLVAATLTLISPFILYYGRYARNEAFVALWGVITIWVIMRYLESGNSRYLYLLTLATVLHFITKETAFIYTAQAMLFAGLLLLRQVTHRPWPKPAYLRLFLLAVTIAMLFVVTALSASFYNQAQPPEEIASVEHHLPSIFINLALAGGVLAFFAALYFFLRGYTLPMLRKERSFDILILLGTLVLPHLAPFPVMFMGWSPLDYSPQGMIHTGLFLIPLTLLAIGLGVWWKWRLWLKNAALFYGIFTLFYTTFFTYGAGFFTGLVGSLGYWMEQQGVRRGSQPWYYYLLVQIPVYEYLPLAGSCLAIIQLLIERIKSGSGISAQPAADNPQENDTSLSVSPITLHRLFTPTLLGFWAITAITAYTVAGEKMPWLTVHMTWPMILLAGWGLGRLIEGIEWQGLRLPTWSWSQLGKAVILAVFLLMALLTARTAIWAAYLHADYATEFLVYAHSAHANKLIAQQITELSERLYGDLSIKVAYDNSDGKGDPGAAWPLTWYLRDFPNKRTFGPQLPREIGDYPVLVISDNNWPHLDPILKERHYSFDYIRMWWPIQDYFDMTWKRIWNALRDPAMRQALFLIWRDRDYSLYSRVVQRDLSLPKWSPADSMRVYVRKDIVTQLWKLGSP